MDIIYEAKKKHGLTQKAIAKMLGKSEGTLIRWSVNKTWPQWAIEKLGLME